MARALAPEEGAGVPDRGADSRVAVWLQRGDATRAAAPDSSSKPFTVATRTAPGP